MGDDDKVNVVAPNSPASANVSPRKRRKVIDSTNAKENESLLKRMGGPSAAKAGLRKDQEEINRIIYEASKGSKYFENEKRNDERITRKVEAMLQKMSEKLRAVPEASPEWQAIERRADAIAARLEEKRDLSRFIVHCDLDMFYAAVELKRDPSLKGKAFGVGKGVLVTASYEARAFGVRSGMASYIAYALCPELITVPNDMGSYVEASRQIMDIFQRFDSNLLQASLDEAYLDLTDYCRVHSIDIDSAVADLRSQVRDETGLTVSVGVAPNTMLAKIGSDKNKPDGQFRLHPRAQACKDFMATLPIRKVPGVGRVTERMLQALGVETCGDIWSLRVRIALVMGDGNLEWLLQYYLGIASSRVEPSKREERKSVGREHTFKPTSDPESLLQLLRESADRVAEDLDRLDFIGKKVTLTYKLSNFQRFTRDQTQYGYVSKADDIFRVVKALLDYELKVNPGMSLRLIGARVSTLKDIRKPKDGGPLKKLWTKASDASLHSSPKKRRVRRDLDNPDKVSDVGISIDHGDLSDGELEEDEEARQLRLAIAASLEDIEKGRKADQGEDGIEKVESHRTPSPNALPNEEQTVPESAFSPSTSAAAARRWSPSPAFEYTANGFARELHRSTPEVMRPPPKERTEIDVREHLEVGSNEGQGVLFPPPEEKAAQGFEKGSASRITSEKSSEKIPASVAVSSAPSVVEPAMICPICSKEVSVRFGSTLAGRNAQLNDHIDLCLAAQGQQGTAVKRDDGKTSNVVVKGKKGREQGTKHQKKKATLERFFGGGSSGR